MLDVPSAFAEFYGQPVEQFRMSGPLSHDAKVFCGFDDASSEELVPHAVYRNACGERVGRAYSPFGQGEAIVRLEGVQRRQKVRSIGLDALGASRVYAAREHARIGERGLLPTNLR